MKRLLFYQNTTDGFMSRYLFEKYSDKKFDVCITNIYKLELFLDLKDEISEIVFVGLFPEIGKLKILLDNNPDLNVKIYLVNGNENLLSDFDNEQDKWCLEHLEYISVENESLCSMIYKDLNISEYLSDESNLKTIINLISTFGNTSNLFTESDEVRDKAMEFNSYLILTKMEDFDDFETEIDYILETDFEKRLNDCFRHYISLNNRITAESTIADPRNKLIVTDSFVDFWYASNSKLSLYSVMEVLLKKFEDKNIRVTCVGKDVFENYVLNSMSLFTENGLETTANYLQSAGALDNFVWKNSGTENQNFMYMNTINRARYTITKQSVDRYMSNIFYDMYQKSFTKRKLKR